MPCTATLWSLRTSHNMHRALRIPETLLNIFSYFSTKSNLAVLARTCRTFKEPALDLLWEELHDLSPLARCLPEACQWAKRGEKQRVVGCVRRNQWPGQPCYSFSRPLKEAEWITLRAYTRRVRLMHVSTSKTTEETLRVVFSAPFDDPLFPHLRSLYWDGVAIFSPLHIAVPSLIVLYLNHPQSPRQTVEEFLIAFGERCPHMKSLEVECCSFAHKDPTVSGLICRWSNLQRVACSKAALDMDAMLHLSSACSLKSLKFTAEIGLVQDFSHLYSKLVLSNLTFLEIRSKFLDTITSLLGYIRLPAIETFSFVTGEHVSRRAIQAYWDAVQETCPSNVLAYLTLCGLSWEATDDFPDDEEPLPCLTLDALRPCTVFSQLRGLEVNFACPVSLTDADILELVSPRMEHLLINSNQGWQMNPGSGGITPSGLVGLLRKCPSLNRLCLAIDTQTFLEIPDGLDVSIPARRQLKIDLLDSYMLPELVPALVSLFRALGLGPSVLTVSGFDYLGELEPSWDSVLDALRHEL